MPFNKQCAHCGKHFIAERNDAKYCNRECGWNAKAKPKPPINCPTCKQEFIPRRNGKGDKYCSQECYFADRRGKPTGKVKEHPTIICETCGKSFTVYPSRLVHNPPRFCAPDCFYEWLDGSERTEYVDSNCLVCGAPIHIRKGKYDTGHGRYCSQKCMIADRPPTPKCEMVKRTCQHCDKPFEIYPSWLQNGDGKFCSKECGYKGRTMPQRTEHISRPCRQCKKIMDLMPYQSEQRFCSQTCAYKYRGPTDIEEIIMYELNARQVAYEFQYSINRYTVDFAFPAHKLVVEADGVYWHSLPDVKEKDRRKNAALTQYGWTVLRFTGDAIRASAAACVDEIVKHLT